MYRQTTIEALRAVATASTPWDTFQALTRAREVLGEHAEAYWPLLESMAQRQTEIERLKRLAGCDALTGVSNRRAFQEAITREVARARRTGESFAVMMLDLDDLKPRNDQLGHVAGDRALIAAAKACQDAIRTSDLVARLGGDEFAVLLSGTDLAGGRVFAERLRASIESIVVDGVPLRVSIGAAVTTSGEFDADALVMAADLDLYRDKAERKSSAERRSEEAA